MTHSSGFSDSPLNAVEDQTSLNAPLDFQADTASQLLHASEGKQHLSNRHIGAVGHAAADRFLLRGSGGGGTGDPLGPRKHEDFVCHNCAEAKDTPCSSAEADQTWAAMYDAPLGRSSSSLSFMSGGAFTGPKEKSGGGKKKEGGECSSSKQFTYDSILKTDQYPANQINIAALDQVRVCA